METRIVRYHSIFDLPQDERKKAEARFWQNTEKTEGCWNWKGIIARGGYGRLSIYVNRLKPYRIYAHRISYELIKGKIPNSLTVDHLCRNRTCVNPAHLEAVSMKENLMRGNGWAAQNARKTHCSKGHPLTNKGHRRICITCQRESERKHYHKLHPRAKFIHDCAKAAIPKEE